MRLYITGYGYCKAKQTPVTAYLKSEQLLLFFFARQYRHRYPLQIKLYAVTMATPVTVFVDT